EPPRPRSTQPSRPVPLAPADPSVPARHGRGVLSARPSCPSLLDHAEPPPRPPHPLAPAEPPRPARPGRRVLSARPSCPSLLDHAEPPTRSPRLSHPVPLGTAELSFPPAPPAPPFVTAGAPPP